VQNLGVAAPAPAANAANAAAPAAPQSVAAAVPLAGLAVEITTQAHAGNKHFEIRLDPPELGRIDVKLDVDRDGNVSTRLVVDRADTLDLLKRDASTLERALQQSGLKTSDNGLEFSLRQQGFARDDNAAQTAAQLVIPDDDPAPLEAMRQGYGRLLGLGGGLDIRV
jgi:flagellar hook-length control protein FliK